MRRTVEERAALYGWTVQQVLDHEQLVKDEVATWPPLSGEQQAVIRTLLGSRTMPARPPKPAPVAAAEPPGENPQPLRRRRIPAPRTATAAPLTTGTAA